MHEEPPKNVQLDPDVGDLVLVREGAAVPMWGAPPGTIRVIDIPTGTVGVIMGVLDHCHYSVITGLGMVMMHDSFLHRLGVGIPDGLP